VICYTLVDHPEFVYAQTLLPGAGTPRPSTSRSRAPTSTPSDSDSQDPSSSSSAHASSSKPSTSSSRKPPKTAPQKLVRTDAQSQTLDSMFPLLSSSSSSKSRKGKEVEIREDSDQDGEHIRKKFKSDHDPGFAKVVAEEQARQMKLARVRISQSECALTSVKNLRSKVIEERNEGKCRETVRQSERADCRSALHPLRTRPTLQESHLHRNRRPRYCKILHSTSDEDVPSQAQRDSVRLQFISHSYSLIELIVDEYRDTVSNYSIN